MSDAGFRTAPAATPRRLARLRDSDLWWSFTHHPTAMGAAAILAVLVVTAFLAPLIAPQDPYDLAQLALWNAELPPIWDERGQWPYLLGTDTQGRDVLSAILYGSRVSIIIGVAVQSVFEPVSWPPETQREYLVAELGPLCATAPETIDQ